MATKKTTKKTTATTKKASATTKKATAKKAESKVMGRVQVKTAGVSFDGRQGKLWNIAKSGNGTEVTMLRREKTNTNDENAIAVLVKIADGVCTKVGYVPKNVAIWLAPMMDEGKLVRAYKGHLVGGSANAQTLGWHFEVCYEVPEKAVAKA